MLLQVENTGKDKRKLQAEVTQSSQQIVFLAEFCIYSSALFQSVAFSENCLFARYAKLQQQPETHVCSKYNG